ncbi:MAG TPA: DUF485 domain-containing protein [Candidatus Limnocylindria bacterium]|jgi:uncharacterized membrane protein (DUF485 family)|nr:DUF485 domain-containing protein [Candidatus Limnocylindria bacterium]
MALEPCGKVGFHRRVTKPEPSDPNWIHSETFLRTLQQRQLRLSLGCAMAFLLVVLGLPLANYFAPEFMAARVGGFTLSWLILGVLFFPFVWCIAWIFIRRSIALEKAEVADVNSRAASKPSSN